MTSPSPSCQCLVAGKGTPPGPGACGQNTSRTPKVRLLPGHGRPRPGGPRPPASPGPAVRRHDTRPAVSSAQGQDQDQRQDAASLREGRCGSLEDNPVNNPVSEPSPTMVEEVFGADIGCISIKTLAAQIRVVCAPRGGSGKAIACNWAARCARAIGEYVRRRCAGVQVRSRFRNLRGSAAGLPHG